MGWLNDVTDFSLEVLNHYRPKMEIYAGVGILLGGTVHACYKTTKLKEINEIALKRVEAVHKKYEMMEVVDENQYKKEIIKARARQVGDIALNYAGDAIAIGGGLALIMDGVHEYDSRLMKSAIAYTNLMSLFNEYRDRNRKEIGAEKEEEIYHDATNKDDRSDRDISDSPYSRLWAESCTDAWDPNPEVSRNFLLMQQASANNLIQSRMRSLGYGWLYLNEVLEMLGYPLTDEGQDVGWFLDPNGEVGNLEGFVDFGIKRPINARFLASGVEEVLEPNCWLDFNCCGNIRPLMFRKKQKRTRLSNVYGH
jgi:hypothetical protein